MVAMVHARRIRIERGDCDPKGIVFYPRYFAIFETCTAQLFERALGMTQSEIRQIYQLAGLPLVTTRGRFVRSATVGDELLVESTVAAVGYASVDVRHRILKLGELAVEGFETRGWMASDAEGCGNAVPIPEAVRAKLA
jgi:4-hydroxybenzoyl-CoA thioesterase